MGFLYVSDMKEELADYISEIGTNEHPDDFVWERERIVQIEAFLDELPSWPWQDGFIPENEFEDYARQFASDVEGFDADGPLASYVDWERYAEAMKYDYSEIDFDGTTYLYR